MAVAVLIVVPMYNNINEQSQLASFLRQTTDGRVSMVPTNERSLRLHVNTTSTKIQLSVINRNVSILPPPILATNISDDVHSMHAEATNDDGIKLANLSSVDYTACCGLGHRLSRMSNAAWIAQQLNLSLRTYWGYCGADTEIFQHLFGVQSKEHLTNVMSTNQHLKFSNEVAGFQSLKRYGNNKTCRCQQEQVQAHRQFYTDLRNRFRYKAQVDEFVNNVFANHAVLGMHIRAGNGEKGDFVKKRRGIAYIDLWVKQASTRIAELAQKEQWNEPPLLYIATDTPSIIQLFRDELMGIMPVIEFPQERKEEGDGIFFGERDKKAELSDYQCIRQWENAVTDMILLSHADLLIAGRMSSFEQTMPMSLVFGREQQKVSTPKCELNFDASRMICSKTYMEWCCNVSGYHVQFPYIRESLLVPRNMNMSLSMYHPTDRPNAKESKQNHLPYYWKPETDY